MLQPSLLLHIEQQNCHDFMKSSSHRRHLVCFHHLLMDDDTAFKSINWEKLQALVFCKIWKFQFLGLARGYLQFRELTGPRSPLCCTYWFFKLSTQCTKWHICFHPSNACLELNTFCIYFLNWHNLCCQYSMFGVTSSDNRLYASLIFFEFWCVPITSGMSCSRT